MQSVTSTVGWLGVRWSRPTAIAVLLLATITFAGEFAEKHHHELQCLPIAQGDHTVHIESATWTEPDSCFGCIGCLPQQRQLAVGTFAPVPGSIEPSASAIAMESIWGLAGAARWLKPSRAPPLA